jgi:predicted transcriptional regulator
MIKPHELLTFLRSIQSNDLSTLINIGYSYSQIYSFLEQAIEKKFIEKIENKYKITEKGRDFITKNLKLIDKNSWISNYDNFRVEKIPIDSIYIPKDKKSKG